jgi:hypothetical protein
MQGRSQRTSERGELTDRNLLPKDAASLQRGLFEARKEK